MAVHRTAQNLLVCNGKVSVVPSRLTVMMISTEAPVDVFTDTFAVPAMATHDGELLARLCELPAGPWLAVVIDEVDLTELTAADMPAYLQACQRVQAWSAARLSAAVDRFASLDGAHAVDKEIALALCEPVGAAQTRIWQARRLRRMLPGVWRRHAADDLTERHVNKLVDATAAIDDPQLAAQVAERVLAHAGGKTAAELARHARDVLKRLDPAGVSRRAKQARDQAGVAFYPAEDGMGDVVVHAPIEDATLVKTAVDAYAAAAKSCGDPRPIGMLRAEAPTRWASQYLTGLADGHVPKAAGRPIEVGITLGLRTALGLDDLPGELPGLGIIPRDVIAAMIRRDQPTLRLLVIDDTDGRLVYRAEQSYRPTPAQVAHVRGTYIFSVGPGSQILATRTDTDHVIEAPHGPTQIGNLIPIDRPWHNSKTKRQLTVTVDDNASVHLTTVLGQTRTVTPYDYRMTDDATQRTSESE